MKWQSFAWKFQRRRALLTFSELQEKATLRVIERTKSWNEAFFPGRRIDMNMVFQERGFVAADDKRLSSSCPGCQTNNFSLRQGETEWYVHAQSLEDRNTRTKLC
jgi:hypothetical protein